jgi:fructose-1,6-bisphosphatase/inositol monophosphatase family enzyme
VNTDGEERRVGETQTELLELAVEAARMAGGLLLERVRAGDERSVTSKSTPTDLVSEADLASERAIKQLLAERRPQDGFVGEEGGSEDGTSGLEWVVDPLDGTVNFLFGIPQWCVSVAVRDRAGSTLAGAVYDPNRGELFTATRDGKAWLSGGGAVDRDSGALAAGAAGSVSRAGECEEDVIERSSQRRWLRPAWHMTRAYGRPRRACSPARSPACATSAAWAAPRWICVGRPWAGSTPTSSARSSPGTSPRAR